MDQLSANFDCLVQHLPNISTDLLRLRISQTNEYLEEFQRVPSMSLHVCRQSFDCRTGNGNIINCDNAPARQLDEIECIGRE